MSTINDVAHLAGVSKATVSYVLSGDKRITETTAKKVRNAVKELNYTANHSARALSLAKTTTIAIISPPENGSNLSVSLGLHMYALSKYASRYGYQTLFINDSDGVAALQNVAASKRADGVVLMDVTQDDPRIEVATSLEIPTVLFGHSEEDSSLDIVDSDYAGEAKSLVRLLSKLGHKEAILFLQSEKQFSKGLAFAWRFRNTFIEEAKSSGKEIHVIIPKDDDSDPVPSLQKAIKQYSQATALVIHNESIVMAAPQIFMNMGIRVPKDLFVATLFPKMMSMSMHTPFTTIETDIDLLAEEVIKTLVERIIDPRKRRVKELLDFSSALNAE
jgi:DNA-binding LacI/PurR family transcriptional regulator